MFETGKAARILDEGIDGFRERDTDSLGAPHYVSERAQALPLDMNTIRQFSFSQPDRSHIPERPSTSGGPARTSDFPLRRDAWKRETRDDFDFPPPGAGTIAYYDFPLPEGLPTPESSHREFLSPRTESHVRSATTDSIEIDLVRAMEASGMAIGMAIGSPTHAPTTWNPQRLDHANSPSPDPTELSMDRSPMPPKQKSKWKMFGGLFGGGKKQSIVQAQNFYQLQGQKTPTTEQQPIRGWTTSEQHSLQKKPYTKRANTAPTRFNLHYGQENPEILVDMSHLEDKPQPRRNAAGNLMLDVDIPSVEMERYSVMFGSLLSGPAVPTATTPNLLTRRQATLDRLKVANDELAQQEQDLEEKERHIKHPRRATSPQPGKSPAFSLFPNTPSRDPRAMRAASPNGRLIRSNTSPAALSPSRPSFAPGLKDEYHAIVMEPGPHIPTPMYESSVNLVSSLPRPKKAQDLKAIVKLAQAQAAIDLHARSFALDQQLSLSPETDDYSASPFHQRPSFSETRQVVSKPSIQFVSSTGSASSQSDHSTSSSISTASTPSTSNTTSNPQRFAIRVPSRSPSPQAQSASKVLPTPMSKFSGPPQTHKTRGRSATTSTGTPSPRTPAPISQLPRPRLPSISGPTNLSSASPSKSTTPNSSSPRPITTPKPEQHKPETKPHPEDENEARLKSLADVSIARQISVSRQQRQLLVPIKGSVRGRTYAPMTTGSENPAKQETNARPTMRARASTVSSSSPSAPSKKSAFNQNFPMPLQNLHGAGINVSRVTSPLSAVEKATREEWEQQNAILVSTVISSSSSGVGKKKREQLISSVKPNTPTLVIVGGNGSSREEEGAKVNNWDGSSVLERKKSNGIAERRRRARQEKDGRGHQYQKSEKVVVEGVL